MLVVQMTVHRRGNPRDVVDVCHLEIENIDGDADVADYHVRHKPAEGPEGVALVAKAIVAVEGGG